MRSRTSRSTKRRADRCRHRASRDRRAPLRWIAQNAGVEGSIVVQKVRAKDEKDANFGYNALTTDVRRHGQGRRHRPDEGHPHGAAERGVHRGPAAHDRSADRREEGRQGTRRRRPWRPRRRHGRHGWHRNRPRNHQLGRVGDGGRRAQGHRQHGTGVTARTTPPRSSRSRRAANVCSSEIKPRPSARRCSRTNPTGRFQHHLLDQALHGAKSPQRGRRRREDGALQGRRLAPRSWSRSTSPASSAVHAAGDLGADPARAEGRGRGLPRREGRRAR
jgi:hypothetical protein